MLTDQSISCNFPAFYRFMWCPTCMIISFCYYEPRAVYCKKILKMKNVVTTAMTTEEVLELAHDKGKESLLPIKLFLETSQLHAWSHGSTNLSYVFHLSLASVKIVNCHTFLLGENGDLLIWNCQLHLQTAIKSCLVCAVTCRIYAQDWQVQCLKGNHF